MLFRDFFPRLQRRAAERYKQPVTERQFKDWREDGLLPGPLPPQGRGRGRSPDRHWPIASYRRALRICRYKQRGAKRQSQWWIMLFLSGEDVEPDRLRFALVREARIERRAVRHLTEQRRYGAGGSKTPLTEAQAAFLRRFGLGAIDPNAVFDTCVDHDHQNSHLDLFSQMSREMFGSDIPPATDDEISSQYRPGHLAIYGDPTLSYIKDFADRDFLLARKLIKMSRFQLGLQLVIANKSDLFNDRQKEVIRLSFARTWLPDVRQRTTEILEAVFAISLDRADGIDPIRRRVAVQNNIDTLWSAIFALTEEMRAASAKASL